MVPGYKQAVGDYIRIQARIQARIPACIQLIFPTGLKQARGFLAVHFNVILLSWAIVLYCQKSHLEHSRILWNMIITWYLE